MGTAEGVRDAMAAIARDEPDVAVVDLSLKDGYGVELVRDLKLRHPRLPVLVLSMHDESVYAERALRAGARGYVTKQEATRVILTAIRKVLEGNVYVSPDMASQLIGRVAGSPGSSGQPLDKLTNRELEVFHLLGAGKTVQQIADALYISPKTVEAHREHIKEKLGFRSSNELLRYALQQSLHGGFEGHEAPGQQAGA
jgi:DNA-binding NarL/FixJ family response regulator